MRWCEQNYGANKTTEEFNMNAKKAREILSKETAHASDIDAHILWYQASSYLEAFEGPEVKSLVRALNRYIFEAENTPVDFILVQHTFKRLKDVLNKYKTLLEG